MVALLAVRTEGWAHSLANRLCYTLWVKFSTVVFCMGFLMAACSPQEASSTNYVYTIAKDAGSNNPATAGASSTNPMANAGGMGHELIPDSGTPNMDATPDITSDSASENDGSPELPSGCGMVVHIGDSLSAYSEPSLTKAYASVGLPVQIDAYGARGIIQKLAEDPHTGETAAQEIALTGFDGCWVVALGTNDTANVSAGAWYSRAEAIDRMMSAIDSTATARVMWVNTFTTRTTGHWKNENMVLWNEALGDAQARWPNLLIYDWASVAATGIAPYSDGIHHTTAGSDVRSQAIAEALVSFFPNP
jgi:hypothetical protein